MGEKSAGIFERLLHEMKALFWIAIYFWVLISLFLLYKSALMGDANVVYHQGLAIITALVLAKVVLIADLFRFGEKEALNSKPLVYPIVLKSILFCLLLMIFDVLEEVLVGVWHGKTMEASLPEIAGGGPRGFLVVAFIMFVALTPFFFYRELCRVLGADNMFALLFKPRR